MVRPRHAFDVTLFQSTKARETLDLIDSTRYAAPIHSAVLSEAAQNNKGLVGVIEVPGMINAGDEVRVTIHKPPH